MTDLEIIQSLNGLRASNLQTVPKKDGNDESSTRDYRRRNTKTVPDRFS